MTAVFSVLCSIVNECNKKWKGLRDTYRKNKKKEKRSGAGAGGGKPWKAFIDPFMEDRQSQTNMAEPGPVSDSESECESKDTDQAAPGIAQVEDQAAPGRAQAVDQTTPGRAQATDQTTPGRAQAADQTTPVRSQAEEQAAGHSRKKTGRGRAQTRSLVDERLVTAIEAVSNRVVAPQPHPKDSDSLLFRSLQEDFKMLSLRTRQDLKFQMYRMVY